MTSVNFDNIKLCSWNIRGLQKLAKRKAVLSFLKKENISVAFLQETHMEAKDNIKLQRNWVGQVFATAYSTFSRGVAILINKNLAFRPLHTVVDSQGRYVIVKGVLKGKDITFMNVYCPPGYSADFLSKVFAEFAELASEDAFVGGDFNCHLSPSLDKLPPSMAPPSRQARMLTSLCSDMGFSDVWRAFCPSDLKFTFFSAPHNSYSRLDYFFIPTSKLFLVSSCTMGNIVLSDHAPVYLVYSLSEERALSKRWRLNSSLLKDDRFISYFTSEFNIFYSINSSSTDDPSLLWETCKVYSRGLIMSYVASRRRKKDEQRKLLETKLDDLENRHVLSPGSDLLKELTATRTALNTSGFGVLSQIC